MLIFLYGVRKILNYFKINANLQLIALLILAFNPLIYSSSLTFMTEIYFLVFMIWSIYFFVRYLESESIKQLLLASLLGGLSIMIRQFGLVLGIAYLFTFFYKWYQNRTFKISFKSKQLFTLLSPFVVFSLVSFLWPKYSSESKTAVDVIFELLEDPRDLPEKFAMSLFILIYFGFFLSPLLLGYLTKLKNKILLLVVLLLPLLTFVTVYKMDIFPIGNILYIENIYGKSNFRANLGVFDNVPFTAFMAYYTGLMGFTLVYVLVRSFTTFFRHAKKTSFLKINQNTLLFVLITVGMYLVVLFSHSMFERYFVNMFVTLTVLMVIRFFSRNQISNFFAIAALIFLIIFILFLNIDFFRSSKLKWEQARKIQIERNLLASIFVDGAFLRHMKATRYPNPWDLTSNAPVGADYDCFVYKYTEDGIPNPIINFFKNIEKDPRVLYRLEGNPKPYGYQQIRKYSWIKNNFDILLYNEEYFSPLYNLIGRKAFVGSYCPKDKVKLTESNTFTENTDNLEDMELQEPELFITQ